MGQTIVAGTCFGRVRAMINDKGEKVEEALPSQPVEVLGFGDVPDAGDTMYAVEADKLSRQVVEERKNRIKNEQLKNMSKVSLDDLFSQISQGQIKDPEHHRESRCSGIRGGGQGLLGEAQQR